MPDLGKIPLSVLVATKNEAPRIARCLEALKDFAEIVVIDSASTDGTAEIAAANGARVVNFEWAGSYPKKRQWCLDILDLAHDWVFFVDADEVVTSALVEELRDMDFAAAGYFVRGQYVFRGRVLKHGLKNNKLALFDRRRIEFPVVDDLDIEGMGEIEGHYQPVLKAGHEREEIGQIEAPLLHYAYEDEQGWRARHARYARWEIEMDKRNAWPGDARLSKRLFKALPFRWGVAFLHSYFLKGGVLDGRAGLDFARSRASYYRMIR
ncbi:MAG: glycosyltransferase family 2 protein [Alphaproteobacteria bacterium]|nr:glycosyltransferase family 2 protein [Alphaproteobacteria bacterium]